jgi:RNase adaptor protein for sRNA GlmZ degradation
VSEEGIECDQDKIVDVRDWPEPKSKTELKSYLGFCGYFIKFILFCNCDKATPMPRPLASVSKTI